ncbi:MAG: YicC/YloC family endoribonuclease [Pseudohongiellaceae bacterium]
MTHSMTAFSRQQTTADWGSLTWEIRSVNHRYLETSVRLPDIFKGLENSVRESLRKQLTRGKVECQLRYQFLEQQQTAIRLDTALVERLINANSELEQITGKPKGLSSTDLLKWPGVIKEEEFDTADIEKQALALFNRTLLEHIEGRAREGEAMKGFIQQRLESIREIVASIRVKLPEILSAQRSTLVAKIIELKADIEPTRFEQEVALLAQKADVDEELDRLNSHLDEVQRVLNSRGQKGRRLDFLMQELNREANTLSSKSIVVETTLNAVELKVLIEQMREQIQNIE